MSKTKPETPRWTDKDAAYIFRYEAGGQIRDFVILGPHGHEEAAGVCSAMFLTSAKQESLPDLLIQSTSRQTTVQQFLKHA